MIQPDFREFQRLAKQGNLIPVYDVFPADLLTPVSAYLRIAQGARYSFLLESVEGGEKIARYTFAGANPEEVFRYAGGACVLESHDRIVWEERDPVSFLRARMERFRPVRLPGLPPLVAGAIGYFSYDMVRLIERLPKRLRDDIGLYDAHADVLSRHHRLRSRAASPLDRPQRLHRRRRQPPHEIQRRGSRDSQNAPAARTSLSPPSSRRRNQEAPRAAPRHFQFSPRRISRSRSQSARTTFAPATFFRS